MQHQTRKLDIQSEDGKIRLHEAMKHIGPGVITQQSDGKLLLIPNPYHRRLFSKMQEPLTAAYEIVCTAAEWKHATDNTLGLMQAESVWWKRGGGEVRDHATEAPSFQGFYGGKLGYIAMGLPPGTYYLCAQ